MWENLWHEKAKSPHSKLRWGTHSSLGEINFLNNIVYVCSISRYIFDESSNSFGEKFPSQLDKKVENLDVKDEKKLFFTTEHEMEESGNL